MLRSLCTYTSRRPNIPTARPHTLPSVTNRQCRTCNQNMSVQKLRKTYSSVHVMCPTFLPSFNHMFIFRSLQYQISRKSIQWKLWDMWKERQSDMKLLKDTFHNCTIMPEKKKYIPKFYLRKISKPHLLDIRIICGFANIQLHSGGMHCLQVKMEAVGSSKTWVHTYQPTWHHISK